MCLYFDGAFAAEVLENSPDGLVLLVDKYLFRLQYFGCWFGLLANVVHLIFLIDVVLSAGLSHVCVRAYNNYQTKLISCYII